MWLKDHSLSRYNLLPPVGSMTTPTKTRNSKVVTNAQDGYARKSSVLVSVASIWTLGTHYIHDVKVSVVGMSRASITCVVHNVPMRCYSDGSRNLNVVIC